MKKPAPFGKYFLLERINVGGMAEVFRAKAFGVEGFERLVAVKRILPNIAEDKEFIRMFIEEAKLSVQLNHANIAQIFDLGVVDGAYYIALEHVHGRDLRGIFDRCRALGEAMPIAQACFMVMKVCEGLDYAHNKRDQSGRELSLVHRDVSPQNVLISFEGEVKIIDFGIAKAAGKGSKTQAGILKGKFGYMSPEQVRGLPVDRRSDVFSCGIVLYELLTGERLFVGESDFSTLEKVRNVEILPPSTYNRKIPDGLEQIVLKALAKDVEDRYQNAIDLHDELQAFVYQTGEFYSRKDLASWMKKTFGKEIEEETAKLESYRQLKPPPESMPQRPSSGSKPPAHTPPPTRRTSGMSAVGTKPPPPPPSRSSGQLPIVAPPSENKRARKDARGDEDSGALAWDEDELETSIYDNPDDDPKNKGLPGKKLPLPPGNAQPVQPVQRVTAQQGAVPPPPPVLTGPDLSSLVSGTSKGWEAGPGIAPQGHAPPAPPIVSSAASSSNQQAASASASGPSPASTLNGIGALNGSAQHKIPITTKPAMAMPAMFEEQSSEPYPPVTGEQSAVGVPALFDSSPSREISSGNRAASQPALFDPMGTFGSGVTRNAGNKRGILMIAIGGAAVAAIAVVAVIALTGDKKPSAAPQPTAVAADPNTGFDLYVSPSGVTQWKLDGEPRTDKLPSRIRSITPGEHTIQIDPPKGFLSQTEKVIVEPGKAGRVEINLEPIKGLVGVFESTPPGAKVTLIIGGTREEIGKTPARAPLDPRNTYQVLFEKEGYVSINRPISFENDKEQKVVVSLEKANGATDVTAKDPVEDPKKDPAVAKDPVDPPKDPIVKKDPVKKDPVKKDPVIAKDPVIKDPVAKDPPKDPVVVKDPPKDPPKDPVAKGTGVLLLNSKPPCEIFIDGKSTGLHTPQREIKLSVGKHKITLINNEYGISESFSVDIKADTPAKMIKDYSDKLPK